MKHTQTKNLNCILVIGLLFAMLLPGTVFSGAYFLVDSMQEWQKLLEPLNEEDDSIREMTDVQWREFELSRDRHLVEGKPIPPSQFLAPELLVYPGDGNPQNPEYPDGPVLLMGWGDPTLPEADYSSGWSLLYGVDPDLTNCTITLKVHPPAAIVMVSFGLKDLEGDMCTWTWFTPANIPNTPPNPATTITINTNDIPGLGVNSSSPACATFSCSPNFDINKVVSLVIGETFHNTPGVFPAPNPGAGATKFFWNAWDEFVVKPNNGGGGGKVDTKWFIKYSQPPVEVDEGLIDGWDQLSYYYDDATGNTFFSMAADDWVCKDERPITDFHWWGSYIGWTQPTPPPQVPDYFKICIWKDVPAGSPGPGGVDLPFSRPGVLVWKHDCYKWVWNFAGYDLDPRWEFMNFPDYDRDRLGDPQENESCFQFNQLLSQDEWFRQEPIGDDGTANIYWLSIAAVYLNLQPSQIQYPWGWKTRPYDPTKAPDVAGVIGSVDTTQLKVGLSRVNNFFPLCLPNPIHYPDGRCYDLAFELTTNEPSYEDNPIPGDIGRPGAVLVPDGKVNIHDFLIIAMNWLEVAP
ncbi:MAG: hypothetical protein FVQ82_10435 [Planctomycetes bacterium]|nr:hypothetical protein [Planctomycetota bacterium]